MAKESGEKVMKSNFADRLNAALESTRQTVKNLNEALVAKKETPGISPPTGEAPAPACPDEGKSA